MDGIKSIIIAGVGGKGVNIITDLISKGLVSIGYDVKVSEIYGMSEKGGSVHAQIRFGDKIYSPLTEKGNADIILGLDRLEALRWGSYLKKDGYMIVNNITIDIDTHKGKIYNSFDRYNNVRFIEAGLIAKETRNVRNENYILIGALIKALDFDYELWKEIFKENIEESCQEACINAMLSGMEEFKLLDNVS